MAEETTSPPMATDIGATDIGTDIDPTDMDPTGISDEAHGGDPSLSPGWRLVRSIGRLLGAFLGPMAGTVAVLLVVDDPTYRLPLLVLMLPLYQRGAGIAIGIYELSGEGRLTRLLSQIRFALMVCGWTLIFGIAWMMLLGFAGKPLTPEVSKISMLLTSVCYVVAGWFWWPYYARPVLAEWPKSAGRIYVKSSRRFDSFIAHASTWIGPLRWLSQSCGGHRCRDAARFVWRDAGWLCRRARVTRGHGPAVLPPRYRSRGECALHRLGKRARSRQRARSRRG
jgi:hypothetical protein